MTPPAPCFACFAPAEGSRCAHCGVARSAGRFTPSRVIAQSPHSRLYQAIDADGTQVALKELLFTLVPSVDQVDAFEREAKLLAELKHPQVPRFLAGFTEGAGAATRFYLAQELIRGESLLARLAHHPFSEAEVVELAGKVLEILIYLHGRTPPVIHRDLKPANLIFRPDGQLSLVDFGSARTVLGVTHRSTLVGTFGYMAPEQLGGTVSARSDLYALGATLAQLITRQPPEQLLGKDAAIDAARLRVSPALRTFLRRLLAPRAEDRFDSAAAALAALRSPGSARRWGRWVGAGLILAVGGVAAAHFTQRASPTAPAPARPTAEAPPARKAPLVGGQPFSWKLAEWALDEPDGDWARDLSGRGHDLKLPTTGYELHRMFGRNWNGSQPAVTVPDSPDFAPTGPFRLDATVMFSDQRLTQTAHLLRRVGDGDHVAWALDMLPGDLLRFTIADESGKTASVEGRIAGRPTHSFSIDANFDSETGELTLFADCVELGRLITDVRPAVALPGAHLEALTHWSGYLKRVSIERGLMLPDGPLDEQCSFVGQKLEDPAELAKKPRPRELTEAQVSPAAGGGVARAELGDRMVFDLEGWREGFSDEVTTTRGQLELRRVEGDAPFLFELGLRLTGELRSRPRPAGFKSVTRFGPVVVQRVYAYDPEVALDQLVAPLRADPRGDPKDATQRPAGSRTYDGVSFPVVEVVEGNWTRLLCLDSPQAALSGGLLESVRGTPQKGQGWRNRLVSVGKGPARSELREVWRISQAQSTTPYLVADPLIRDATRHAASDAERAMDKAAFRVGKALEQCSPVVHEQRLVRHEVLAMLQGGLLLAVESKGDQPPPKVLACLKEKVAALKLSPDLSQLAFEWAHEGEKTDFERSIEASQKAIATALLLTCASEEGLLEGLARRGAKLVAVIKGAALVELTASGGPTPPALRACLEGKLEATPLFGDEPVRLELPLKQ